eukprot:scaffold22445_cov73-Phaeocystis_antarctica.AAC.7
MFAPCSVRPSTNSPSWCTTSMRARSPRSRATTTLRCPTAPRFSTSAAHGSRTTRATSRRCARTASMSSRSNAHP